MGGSTHSTTTQFSPFREGGGLTTRQRLGSDHRGSLDRVASPSSRRGDADQRDLSLVRNLADGGGTVGSGWPCEISNCVIIRGALAQVAGVD